MNRQITRTPEIGSLDQNATFIHLGKFLQGPVRLLHVDSQAKL